METRNIFDPTVKKEITDRIHHLNSRTQRQWGKMDAAQMLAHVQVPMGFALGTHPVRPMGGLIGLILPLFKRKLYDNSEWKQNLPTNKDFVMTAQQKDFDKEKTQLLDMLNRFTESNIVNDRHPVFGRFSKEQWGKATWKHLDHHLRQFGV